MTSDYFYVSMPQFTGTTQLSSYSPPVDNTGTGTHYYTGDIVGLSQTQSTIRTYVFQISKAGKFLVGTCDELCLKVQGSTKDILLRKAQIAVALLRGGSTFDKKYLTLWGTHNG